MRSDEQGLPIFFSGRQFNFGKPQASSLLFIYFSGCRQESAFKSALLQAAKRYAAA